MQPWRPAVVCPHTTCILNLTALVNKYKYMQKITPFLWFNNNAEEAMNFYTSTFKNSKIVNVTRYGDAGPGPKGDVMMGTIEIENQPFYLLNGGSQYTFNPSVSFFVSCTTQQEIDELWDKLSAGGNIQACGWLQDKFGLSWQIVPYNLGSLIQGPDPEKSARVMKAMMQMIKLDMNVLQEAYDGT